MFKLINRLLTLAAILFLGFLLVIAIPAFQDPQFRITNMSSLPVTVKAIGKFGEKVKENIQPGEYREFSLEAEGAITFSAQFSDGHIIKNRELYFSEGVDMAVNITREHIEVNYLPEKE